ncbi:unnamed protein product [Prorocentrum cordatum]|uniref:SET domain-containing protein n=1 Tax=Prorocentrum cordatum TaxID=2364126 RepID=A0ABN9R955_9DINO|nr:unnamed protein product [Polarella glacialis]
MAAHACAASRALQAAVASRSFRCRYHEAFGAFPQDRVFVPGVVDAKGLLAPLPADPRAQAPVPSPHVLVAPCPAGHPLAGQLRCTARRALAPGFSLPYAGELYRGRSDHHYYSSTYSCSASGGMVVDGLRYCNEAAFVNHYYGIADSPNCRLAECEQAKAAVSVVSPIAPGEELLVDYGLEYCTRNQAQDVRLHPGPRCAARLTRGGWGLRTSDDRFFVGPRRWPSPPPPCGADLGCFWRPFRAGGVPPPRRTHCFAQQHRAEVWSQRPPPPPPRFPPNAEAPTRNTLT